MRNRKRVNWQQVQCRVHPRSGIKVKRHETHSDTGRRRADGKVMAETERSPSSAKTLDVPELFVNLADLQLLVSLSGNES